LRAWSTDPLVLEAEANDEYEDDDDFDDD